MGKPAARIGDMHVCPMEYPPHVGGPVITGSTNVFIGGMPAATVGDMCTCMGPPDTIAQGSASVFINGKPAARLGDSTAHGGRIVMGCFTVFIGDGGSHSNSVNVTLKDRSSSNTSGTPLGPSGVGGGGGGTATIPKAQRDADKKARYEARLALIAQGRQRAKALRGKPQTDPWSAHRDMQQAAALSSAADRLERDNKAIERARLADHIYHIGEKPPVDPPEGWSVKESYEDPRSGFMYAVYESSYERPPKPVLVFRGSTGSIMGPDWKKTNGPQGIGMETEQYDRSMDKAFEMQQEYGPNGFEIAGHSKAGGQTAAASVVTGAKGYGFNSAGLHPNTVLRRGHTREEAAGRRADGTPLVDAYNFKYDELSNIQDGVTPALKAGLSAHPLTNPLGQALTLGQAGPPAAGQRHVLAPVDANGKSVRLNPIKYGKFAYHSMSYLIDSMEHEKQQDAAVLGNVG